MNGRSFSFGNSGHPLVQALSLLGFAVLLVGAVIMGAFVLMAVVGLALIAFVAFRVRAWWLRRRGPKGGPPPGPLKGVRYIEGEYEVIERPEGDAERRRDDERR